MLRRGKNGHGGGHGGGWIVTYSDMVTLLMTFFICIITFGTRETENYIPSKGTLVGTADGSGVMGAIAKTSLQRDAVVWRPRYQHARLSANGSEIAPMYKDPSPETAASILRALEDAAAGRLSDDFVIRLPLALLFEKEDRLSASGVRVLHAIAVNLRELPYDLRFQVGRDEDIARAVKICGLFMMCERYEPARLAVGTRPATGGDSESLWLVLARQF
jgi:flagellar motor protein MotB